MQLFPPLAETIEGAAQELRAGRRTCEQLVAGCLAQIDQWERAIRAWVSVDRGGALQRARELDVELRAGRDLGPLHGIPLGIKDLIDVAGTPTGCGSTLMADAVAAADAPLVSRLRQAGAIILGKTVTTQFACFDPPPTRNPWNVDRTPGGSSSGSAAAVAAGMCLGAVGSQTGGSIIRPAAYCGVCGCKPGFGAIDTTGVFPVALSLDHPGPLARTIDDLALLLEALSPGLIRGQLSRNDEVAPAFSKPPRLARLRGLFEQRAEPDMLQTTSETLRILESAGASVLEGVLPTSFDEVIDQHRVIMLFELSQVHRERVLQHADSYLPVIRGLLTEGARLTQAAYERALAHRDRLKSELTDTFEGADVLVMPATAGVAPDAGKTGSPVFNSPWSYVGLPAATFPMGLSPGGLPLGIQLVGRERDEQSLLAAARWCEQAIRRQSERL